MELERLEHNGGDLWVNKKEPIVKGDTVFIEDNIAVVESISDSGLIRLRVEKQFYTEIYDDAVKIVAQSITNPSYIIHVPFVEVGGIDVKALAEKAIGGLNVRTMFSDKTVDWDITQWIKGYEAGQADMFSQEDVRKIVTAVAYDVREKGFGACSVASHYGRVWMEEHKKLLQLLIEQKGKKVDRIEIETEVELKPDWYKKKYNSIQESIKGIVPVTYQKDGKTFLKLK